VLARAVAREPEVLIMVEPTSAVDAHTEALIAERLADYRRGRTTIVTTGSPLLLHYADRVAFLSGERVAAYGTHEELLRTSPGYRGVVARALDDDMRPEPVEGPLRQPQDGPWTGSGPWTSSGHRRNGEEG